MLSAANLVQDGGFETPALTTGYSLFTAGQQLGPWTVVGASGSVATLASSYTEGSFTFNANDGTQSLDLTGLSNTPTGIQQSIPTTVGTSYTLSFAVGNQVDNDSNPVFGTTSTVLASIDGVQVVSVFNNARNGSAVSWKVFNYPFTATQTSTVLTFTNGDGRTDNYNGLDSVSITTGPQLAFTQAPSDGSAGTPLNPKVAVEIKDAAGNVVTSDNSTVITLLPVGFNSDKPIQNNTATVVAGIATFDNLILPKAGSYQLQATDAAGDAAATSGKFKITGDKLRFLTQPRTSDIDKPIPLTVEILDQSGKLDTTATSSAVLSLNVVSGGVNAQLGGTTAAQFIGGKAIFNATNGPTINARGTYTLTATEEDTSSGVLAPNNVTTAITSKPLQVSGFHLAILKQPVDTAVNAGLSFSVAIEYNHEIARSVHTGRRSTRRGVRRRDIRHSTVYLDQPAGNLHNHRERHRCLH